VKGDRGKIANRPERPASVGRQQRLGRVLDHAATGAWRDRHDRVHLAADAGIVHRNDRAGSIGDGCLDLPFVDVEGVGRMSTNTGTAPRKTKALAVETNVYDGMMTSSLAFTSASRAAISSPAVQECVSIDFAAPVRDSIH
jgi:hypothetical protein